MTIKYQGVYHSLLTIALETFNDAITSNIVFLLMVVCATGSKYLGEYPRNLRLTGFHNNVDIDLGCQQRLCGPGNSYSSPAQINVKENTCGDLIQIIIIICNHEMFPLFNMLFDQYTVEP